MTDPTAARPDSAWSARWSDRVSPDTDESPADRGPWSPSAPESLVPLPWHPPNPEGHGRAPGQHHSRAQVLQLERRLSDRDRAILTSLQLHRFLTTTQLQRFHFTGHDTVQAAARICRRTLSRLEELQIIQHLGRRIGGVRAGSAAHVWQLGLLGDRLLRLHDADRRRARRKEPSLRNLLHWLAVADTHLALLPQDSSGPELLLVETEPDSWRGFTGPDGQRSLLKPDLYAVTAIGDYEDHWLFEVDLGTESLPTQLDKCRQYVAYRASGSADQAFGLMPRAVWIMPSDAHADRLARAIAKEADLPSELFRVCTLTGLGQVIRGGAA